MTEKEYEQLKNKLYHDLQAGLSIWAIKRILGLCGILVAMKYKEVVNWLLGN